METIKNSNLSRLITCGILMVGTAGLPVQAQEDDEIYELSPFEVDASEDSRYRARNTLAGSRVNTSLEDLGASISVITAEFMDDVAAVDINDLLVYTANTESLGNYTATSGDLGRQRDDASNNSQGANRVRGLTRATIARDFFSAPSSAGVGFDTYSLERVTINRGPNSSLFGLGSAGGIINFATKKASLGEDFNEVKLRYGTNDDLRSSFDVNRVLVEDKLAVRVAGLYADKGFRQQPAYDYDRRIYLAAHWKPFKNTSIRFDFETINRNQNNPNAITLGDNVSPWINSGRPAWNPSAGDPGALGTGMFGDALGLTSGAQGVVNPATGDTESFFYARSGDPNSPGGDFATATVFHPNSTGALLYTPLSLSHNEYVNHHKVNFNPNSVDRDVDVFTISLDQKIAENFYFNLAYFKEKEDRLSRNYNRGSSFNLNVDPNTHLPDGTANSHFGELYINQRAEDTRNVGSGDTDSIRATLSYELDLREISDWIGTFTLTGYYEDHQRDSASDSYNENRVGSVSYLNPRDKVTASPWRMDRRQYLGGIGSAVAPVTPNSQSSAPGTYWDVEAGEWATDTFATDFVHKSRRKDNTGVEAKAVILQGKVLKDYLTFMAGWRDDEQTVSRSNSLTISPDTGFLVVDNSFGDPGKGGAETITLGGVIRVPGADWLLLHYNQSENFIPRAAAVNILGESLPSPTGEGIDEGFSVNLIEGKLFAKFNWYEVTAANGNPGGDTSIVARWELSYIDQDVMRFLAESYGDTSYQPAQTVEPWGSGAIFASADTVSKGMEIELTYNPIPNWTITANASKQEAVASNVGGAINRFLDERLPYWQGVANGQAWSGTNTFDNWGISENGEGWYNFFPLDAILTYKSGEGKPNPQIRRWRWNAITNYEFTEGKLQGVNVGGAARWQDKSVIGHPAFSDVVNGNTVPIGLDFANPYTTPSEIDIDLWFGWGTKIWDDKIDLYLQLNIRNVFDSSGFTPILANSDGRNAVYRIDQPRTYYLSSTFKF